jgi:VanZ family protein
VPDLRFPRLWQFLGGLGCLLVVYFSLTPSPPNLGIDQGDKLGHLAAYAGLMWWFSQLDGRVRGRLAFAAAFVALGIGLEFAQRATGYRSFELADMAADALGVLIGWLAAPPRLPNLLSWSDRRLAGS